MRVTRPDNHGVGVVSFGAAGQQGTSRLAAPVAGRLDGDAFAGSILQSQAMGQPRLSPAGVPESLLLLVPGAVWPSSRPLGHAKPGCSGNQLLRSAAGRTSAHPPRPVRRLPAVAVADRIPGLPRCGLRLVRTMCCASARPRASSCSAGRSRRRSGTRKGCRECSAHYAPRSSSSLSSRAARRSHRRRAAVADATPLDSRHEHPGRRLALAVFVAIAGACASAGAAEVVGIGAAPRWVGQGRCLVVQGHFVLTAWWVSF